MTPTLAPTEATAVHAKTGLGVVDRVMDGPWSANQARAFGARPLPTGRAPASAAQPPEWYARPWVVCLAVTGICASFWGTIALGASALF